MFHSTSFGAYILRSSLNFLTQRETNNRFSICADNRFHPTLKLTHLRHSMQTVCSRSCKRKVQSLIMHHLCLRTQSLVVVSRNEHVCECNVNLQNVSAVAFTRCQSNSMFRYSDTNRVSTI